MMLLIDKTDRPYNGSMFSPKFVGGDLTGPSQRNGSDTESFLSKTSDSSLRFPPSCPQIITFQGLSQIWFIRLSFSKIYTHPQE